MIVDFADYDTPKTVRTPEEQLWCQVILIAVQDFKTGDTYAKTNARYYFMSDAFEQLCKLLELDVVAIRERLGISLTYSPVGEVTPAPEPKPRKRMGRPRKNPDELAKRIYVPKVRDTTPELELELETTI